MKAEPILSPDLFALEPSHSICSPFKFIVISNLLKLKRKKFEGVNTSAQFGILSEKTCELTAT